MWPNPQETAIVQTNGNNIYFENEVLQKILNKPTAKRNYQYHKKLFFLFWINLVLMVLLY